MKNVLRILTLLLLSQSAFAQQGFYDVVAGNGNGVRFWASDANKIHMGLGAEYQYGPVTDYSIKMNAPSNGGRGWVWGVQGVAPIAALGNTGVMQIAQGFYAGPYMYTGAATGLISTSGTGAGFTLMNRSITSFVLNPTNGERWSIYSDGPTTDGKFSIWSGANFFTIKKDGKTGIGTDAPTARLEVVGAGGSNIDFRVNGRMQTTGGGLFVDVTQSLFMGTPATGKIGFYNNLAWRLTVDNTGKVGIGTESPASRLDVVGTGGTALDMKVNGRIMTGDGSNLGGVWLNSGQTMFVGQSSANTIGLFNNGAWNLVTDNSSRVGIGVTSPTARLDVAGLGAATVDLKVTGRIKTGDAGALGGVWLDGPQTMLVGQFGASTMGMYSNGAWRFVMDNTGRVGIGTTAPDAMLAVKGTVHAKEVKVDLTGAMAPDYVFESDYKLPSLESVEEYITENHHLPEVPSAADMEKNGMNVGEMNLLLLKKIEELTLYVIEIKKENLRLRQEMQKSK